MGMQLPVTVKGNIISKDLCTMKSMHLQREKRSKNIPFKSLSHMRREQWAAKEQCCVGVFPQYLLSSIYREVYLPLQTSFDKIMNEYMQELQIS